MIRILDILFSFLALIIFFPLLMILYLIGYLDTGSPLFIQKRVGLNQKEFKLFKFRTMKIGTLSTSSHLVDQSQITAFGHFLRKYKLDELPQLLNVVKGDMSLVGPRPCLCSQTRLIRERKKRKIFKARPGMTGLAQIKGINMKNPLVLAKTDLTLVKQMNSYYYIYYILMTILLVLKK
jgi:lipopolysaccharide/colanic/teichoic acid biosynthesis glycosyltransferase